MQKDFSKGIWDLCRYHNWNIYFGSEFRFAAVFLSGWTRLKAFARLWAIRCYFTGIILQREEGACENKNRT